MRAILHGFHEPMHQPILDALLKELRVQYCQLTYSGLRQAVPAAVTSVIHYWWDLNWGQYHVDWNTLRPLDEELLGRLAGAEVIFLKMCDRLEYAFPQSYQQRKNLFLKHVRYWNHVILEERIDLFLSLNIPHETFDYVIYALCKLHGVPTLMMYQSQVPDTALPMEDWEKSTAEIGSRYAELAQKYSSVSEEEIELTGRFQRDYETQTSRAANPTPFYMAPTPPVKGPSWRARAANVARVVRQDPSLIRTRVFNRDYWIARARATYEERERARLDQEMLSSYDAVAVEPDLDKPFIYLALHYQPELTTCPLAGAFVEQTLIAQLIAATMPDDVQLYIKEHPMQKKLIGRHAGYYEALRSLPRTRLIKRSFDTFALIERCAAVATATGTVGWEALYRGKPILLFGHNFYQYASGVFPIRSAEDGLRAMTRIFSEGFRPTIKDIKVFLKALEDTTFHCYLTPEYGKNTRLTEEQNLANIVAALTKWIPLRLAGRS